MASLPTHLAAAQTRESSLIPWACVNHPALVPGPFQGRLLTGLPASLATELTLRAPAGVLKRCPSEHGTASGFLLDPNKTQPLTLAPGSRHHVYSLVSSSPTSVLTRAPSLTMPCPLPSALGRRTLLRDWLLPAIQVSAPRGSHFFPSDSRHPAHWGMDLFTGPLAGSPTRICLGPPGTQ